MVELSDEEFTIIKDFIDAIELPEDAPQELIDKYTNALQVVGAFGQEGQQQEQEVMAPMGGAGTDMAMTEEDMKKMRDMAAMMMQMMDKAMGSSSIMGGQEMMTTTTMTMEQCMATGKTHEECLAMMNAPPPIAV